MTFAFDPPPFTSVAVANDAARFPVRRIYCVGRNYAKHAREMGGDPDREAPFFFAKPADAVVDARPSSTATIPYPPLSHNVHHEVELAVALQGGGRDLAVSDVKAMVFGYAVSIDLTRRDLQKQAKSEGRPWALSKGFDHSAPLGALHRAHEVGHLEAGRIWLKVDDELRQDADLAEMVWPVFDIVSILSRSVKVAAGDIILTGTPAGVGPVVPGQVVTAGVEGLSQLSVAIVEGESA